MRKIVYSLFVFCFSLFICVATHAADERFLSCGPGYVLVSKNKIDGVPVVECQKLWCRDLESGKTMGDGNSPASGYKTTGGPVELCDAQNNCIECFGDRKWCEGEANGIWNSEYGAYTRGGADSASYISYLRGGCFAWRLEKPTCSNNQTAILRDGEWVCAISSGTTTGGRASSVRRTGTTGLGRMVR